MKGTVFDIKRFAVHDGGGLRSTLFFKGCPLHCPWCQNPESIDPKPLLWYGERSCLGCGTCAAVCPQKALTLDTRIHIDRAKCTLCGLCEEACPAGALKRLGHEETAEEAAAKLLRDQVFFGEKGGVTLSGGEVLFQWRFACRVLEICKEAGADTAIESCLLGSREAVEALRTVVDHFIVDVKLIDPAQHRQWLGADNAQILKNYEYLVSRGADILVRTPLIPGFTATEANIRGIARYLVSVDPEVRYELLNFNPLCRSKYSALEQEYPVEGGAFSEEELERFYGMLAEAGVRHIVKE